jgi:SAM-dependent methyltransferase
VPVHPQAAVGFGLGAAAYERGRPEHPPETIDCLVRELSLSSRTTAIELGAGTGKLTRLLAPRVGRYLAVEPVRPMREQFVAQVPGVPLVGGVAEALPLHPASAQVVLAANAFHWFDTAAALAEIRRVLRPGGQLGIVFSVRDESVRWVAQMSEIFDRYGRGALRRKWSRWREVVDATPGFGPLEERRFRFEHVGTRETTVDRFLSVSFIATLPEEDRRRAMDEFRVLLESDPETRGRSEIATPYVSEVYWSRPLPS